MTIMPEVLMWFLLFDVATSSHDIYDVTYTPDHPYAVLRRGKFVFCFVIYYVFALHYNSDAQMLLFALHENEILSKEIALLWQQHACVNLLLRVLLQTIKNVSI